MPFFNGPVSLVQRTMQRVLSDFYEDPFFRLMDPSFHHFPLALTGSLPVAAAKSLTFRGPLRAPLVDFSPASSDSEDMEVQEVIQIDDSDDEEDRVIHRSSIMESGRKRKVRREVKRSSTSDKKRSREESEAPSTEQALEAPHESSSERPSDSKKSKSDSEEASPMEVDESSTDLFGWKPVISTTEHDDHFLIEAKLPGFSKNEVNINLDEYENSECLHLKLTASKTVSVKDPMESTSVRFTRLIPLPRSITTNDISASWEHGYLKVSVKKPVETQTQQPVAIPVVDAAAQPSN